MRALILVAVAALAGCGNNDQKDNTINVDENLTAENIVSNDVTAIDAVTGDASNMAADVDMNYGNLEENAATPSSNMPAPASAAKPPRPAPRPSAPAPVSNTVATNTTTTTNAE